MSDFWENKFTLSGYIGGWAPFAEAAMRGKDSVALYLADAGSKALTSVTHLPYNLEITPIGLLLATPFILAFSGAIIDSRIYDRAHLITKQKQLSST